MGLVIIILALCWAVGDGVSNATSSVRENYRTGRDRRHAKADRRRKLAARGGGPAPRSASTGVKVASGAVTIGLSSFLVARGFIDGFRAGWPKGKERARRWADTRKNGSAAKDGDGTPPDDPGSAPAAKSSTKDDGGKATVHVITSAPSASAPKTPAAEPSGGPVPNPSSTSGGSTPVSINTVTGGEVHSYEQLLAELNSIAVEAHAELEDAQADAERARQDAERIDTMVGSLTELELDRETLGKVSALTESASARLEAANARAVAAETRASGAMETAQHVQQTHQALAEAYASAPEGGAKKEFYTA
ncbi:hypothetical protein G4Z16_13855 [Streptomyces bathyalis]|uniref:Uncharacterized protein n=1 Tax=Streptomyces bathyalis TaxID=2710756 RepID=A0A7T1T6G9_9ACTN|nr:hypothetical protein [Streptomyces bathyalis]QPP07290.1 hypothetical protein G4Z16_13855 [Streptomyces bathyalis]